MNDEGGKWGSALGAAVHGQSAQSEYDNITFRQATKNDHFEIVKLLLTYGADQDIPGF